MAKVLGSARVLCTRACRRLVLLGVVSVAASVAVVPSFPRGAHAAIGDITTVAGTGSSGYSGDGSATAAQLNYPDDVAVDAAGNLFVADRQNHRIRKVSTSGVITTVAGIGTAGFSGDAGPATLAQLQYPRGVAIDDLGNVYIADTTNERVRKVDTSGIITTIAGTGTSGYTGDGAAATSAQLHGPVKVDVDSSGNVYVADRNNHSVRKVDTSGVITTIAGTGTSGYTGDGGTATSAKLNYPEGVASGPSGTVYIADMFNQRIRKVDTSGVITTIAGTGTSGYSGDGGAATSAQVSAPYGIDIDGSGVLHIADTGNFRIRKVNSSGTISTVAGTGTSGYSGDGGPATSARLAYAAGVAVDSVGNVFVADTSNHRVRMVQNTSTSPPTSTTTSVPVATSTTLPSLGFTGYPSDDCSAGTNVVKGWIDDAYSSVQAAVSTSATSICFAHEQGAAHVGGKVTVSTAVPAVPTTDDNQPACADPAMAGDYQLVRDVSVLGRQVKVDAKLRPSASAPTEAWVCVKADTVEVRVIVPTTVSGLPNVSLDSSAPHSPPYAPTAAFAGKASSLCQTNGGEAGRLANLTVGATPVWVYRWQEFGTRAHVCVRFGPAVNDGGRLTLDTNGGVTLVGNDAGSDRTPCPQQVFDDAGPPPSWLYISNAGSTPAWACVRINTTYLRVKLDPSGGQGVATFVRDS